MARKFTDEQEQEICRRYLAGETTGDIARSFHPCTTRTISQAIRRQGGTLRTQAESIKGRPNMALRIFTDEQEAEICHRYLSGESAPVLAAAFKASPQSIFRTLKRNGLKPRSLSEARIGRAVPSARSLSEAQELEVCARYQAGESTVRLASAYGVTSTGIRGVLDRHGIARRSIKEARGGLSDGQEAEACRRYEQGETTYELAADFGVSDSCIGHVLARHGVERRTARKFTDEQEMEMCARYKAGESSGQLSDFYGSNDSVVSKILRKHGVEVRSSKALNDEQEGVACLLYSRGFSSYEVGEMMGVSSPTVFKALKNRGIEARKGCSPHDGLQNALNGSGRFVSLRECELYLFTLSRYASTHCKIGIAFNTDKRADDEYGDEVLRLVFASRTEAFFVEEAAKNATRTYSGCPDDLLGWSGYTEVRAMPASDMLPIVVRLADELDELGMWEFAARYVPMTAAQRAQCQQRALEAIAA